MCVGNAIYNAIQGVKSDSDIEIVYKKATTITYLGHVHACIKTYDVKIGNVTICYDAKVLYLSTQVLFGW